LLVPGIVPDWLRLLHAGGLALVSMLAALWLTHPSIEEIAGPLPASAGMPGEAAAPTAPVDAPAGASAADRARIEALLRLMQEQYAWRDNGLTIGALAQRLGLTEHRLRQLINRHLGYRNFSDFLNRYRLDDAAGRLRDPAEAPLPILSIALDCGYSSLPPFNRAFKARFGMTPSQYRQQAGTA
jgi:AraC-like DNA-binding protein